MFAALEPLGNLLPAYAVQVGLLLLLEGKAHDADLDNWSIPYSSTDGHLTQNGPMRVSPGGLAGTIEKETVCVAIAKPVGCEPGAAGGHFYHHKGELLAPPQDDGNTRSRASR